MLAKVHSDLATDLLAPWPVQKSTPVDAVEFVLGSADRITLMYRDLVSVEERADRLELIFVRQVVEVTGVGLGDVYRSVVGRTLERLTEEVEPAPLFENRPGTIRKIAWRRA